MHQFITTLVYLGDSGSDRAALVIQAETGQTEMGHVNTSHLDSTVEDHIVRRIRELWNVGLCHGYQLVYSSPADSAGRSAGTTMVFEHDFDSDEPWSSTRKL